MEKSRRIPRFRGKTAWTDSRFGKPIYLFRTRHLIFTADMSVPLLTGLVLVTFALRVFPAYEGGLSPVRYWLRAADFTFGLALSLLGHELARLSVARRLGHHPRGILFYIFGSAAEGGLSVGNRWQRAWLNVAGILFSAFLGLIFYALCLFVEMSNGSRYLILVLFQLGNANVALAALQCLPALPLDGGRYWLELFTENGRAHPAVIAVLNWLTYLFAAAFGAAGLVLLTHDWPVLGAWILLIGIALAKAGLTEHEYVLTRNRVIGHPVRDFMNTTPVTVSPSIPLSKFKTDYLDRYPFQVFPVTSEGALLGSVKRNSLRRYPSWERSGHSVAELLVRKTEENTISPDTDAGAALSLMMQTGNPRFLITQWNRLIGIISYGDLLHVALDPGAYEQRKSL